MHNIIQPLICSLPTFPPSPCLPSRPCCVYRLVHVNLCTLSPNYIEETASFCKQDGRKWNKTTFLATQWNELEMASAIISMSSCFTRHSLALGVICCTMNRFLARRQVLVASRMKLGTGRSQRDERSTRRWSSASSGCSAAPSSNDKLL